MDIEHEKTLSLASYTRSTAKAAAPPLSGLMEPNVWQNMNLKSIDCIVHPMKFRQVGFTLVELLITFALVAILASLAIPSFQALLVKRSLQAAADSLVSDMRFARSEALKRSTRTTICRSLNTTSCAGTGSWSDGWIVFVDMNSNSVVDPGDDIVKVQQAFENIASIRGETLADPLASFKYEPTGFAKAATQTFVFIPKGSVVAGSTRIVCVSMNGRPALRTEGATACN
jgi:type IV fimbrial biogenesis protein FimT